MADLNTKIEAARKTFPEGEPGPVKPCPKPVPPKPEKTWVEVALIDMVGKPVPGARYHVRVPGESKAREGKLDINGRVNFRELDPGTCYITFPDYDKDAWGRPPGHWPIQRAKPETPLNKTWVEVALINMAGKPVAGARYRVQLPGEGSPRSGTLDAKGRVSFHKIDPGTCHINFPDYDKDAWERVETAS